MKRSWSLVSGVFLCGIASAQGPIQTRETLTPAQQKIAAGKKAIESAPERPQSYNQLAIAFERRAAETGDVSFYDHAEDALKKSFSVSAENLEAQKIRASVLLGEGRYQEALEQATAVNKLWPDDVLVYGYVADAQIALGNYAAAEQAVQWMLNLRPGNIPGMRRAADLREVFGDADGAADMLTAELVQTAPTEVADRAYVMTRLGHLQLAAGHLTEAEKLLQQAHDVFPNLPYTLDIVAELRRAQSRYAEAAQILNQLYLMNPSAEQAYRLAVALEREGQQNYAESTYQEFERKALQAIDRSGNANVDLVFYYADHAAKPQEALQIAETEFSRRQNVRARDAYAWALAVNGRFAEARTQVEAALEVGTRDPGLFFHAGAIATQGRDPKSGAAYFKASLDVNPLSEFAPAARQALEKLAPASALASAGK
jgi:tetratricopeptide (TPR) repeat protein